MYTGATPIHDPFRKAGLTKGDDLFVRTRGMNSGKQETIYIWTAVGGRLINPFKKALFLFWEKVPRLKR
jgi:hypothetical protein